MQELSSIDHNWKDNSKLYLQLINNICMYICSYQQEAAMSNTQASWEQNIHNCIANTRMGKQSIATTNGSL